MRAQDPVSRCWGFAYAFVETKRPSPGLGLGVKSMVEVELFVCRAVADNSARLRETCWEV